MNILITGVAGFIGFHLAKQLLQHNYKIIGIDNLNNYYSIALKKARLKQLITKKNFEFFSIDITHSQALFELFKYNHFDYVIHLAAQVGVRYSLENPHTYINNNIVGFANVLENCRNYNIKQLVFASSSSIYGSNENYPFDEKANSDYPQSLYAATKKTNEVMAFSYTHLFQLPCVGLRFFTVYGPWGRPDMAIYKFTESILQEKSILLYNYGTCSRDFTYIDDVVQAISLILGKSQLGDYHLYNVANGTPIELNFLIKLLEKSLHKKAIIEFHGQAPGDMTRTHANITTLKNKFGYFPKINLEEGIKQFITWYKSYAK